MSIISISGKIGTDKDTVAAIIQYLVWKDRIRRKEITSIHNTFEDFLNISSVGYKLSGWEIRRFADKLKDIVCLLIGCTREQLEDRDFKEAELGEKWWYYKHNIEGKILSIAEFDRINALNMNLLNSHYTLVKPTPRLLMQLLGTNCGRIILHPNIWVNSLMIEYKAEDVGPVFSKKYYPNSNEKDIIVKYPNWIISDTRFPNELKAVKDRNGVTIRITRPDFVENALTGEKFPVKVHRQEHESETALDNSEFDYTIDNNGTIDDLRDKVEAILKQEKIIS